MLAYPAGIDLSRTACALRALHGSGKIGLGRPRWQCHGSTSTDAGGLVGGEAVYAVTPDWIGPALGAWPGVLLAVIAPVSAFLAVRGVRLAIVASPAGVVVRNCFVTRRMGWHEIAAINPPDLAGTVLDKRLTFVLYDGRAVGSTAFSGDSREPDDFADGALAALRQQCRHRCSSSRRGQW